MAVGHAFSNPQSVSVDPTDGSCWVTDYGHDQVVHLSVVGAELWRSAGGAFSKPPCVSVNPMDGSCWVTDIGHSQVVHLCRRSSSLSAPATVVSGGTNK